WIRLISDDHISSFCIKKILENSTLIVVLIVARIVLNLTNGNVGKAPDSRVGIQPPVSAIFFAWSRLNIQLNSGQINFIQRGRKFISKFPKVRTLLISISVTTNTKNRPPFSVFSIVF